MAIKRIQKGSPEAFMQAVENKIAELGGDVTSSTKVTASYENGLSGEDQYAAEQALQILQSGDEDDIETAVSYAVNLVNNANAEADYEDEDFYMNEADYDTVLAYVKRKMSGGSANSCETVEASEDPYNYDVYDWVADHRQAAEDAENHFGCSLNDIDYVQLLGWIYDHGQLWTDFVSRFTDEARWYIEDELGEEWDDDIEASTDIKAADEYDDNEYLDALKLAVEGYVEAQGYSCIASVVDNLYFEVEIYDEDEEDFETPLHTYVLDLEDIEPNMDEVDEDAETIADDAISDYESTFDDDEILDDVDSATDIDEEYTEIRSKSVPDSDGFMTDYTMYRNNETGTYFFMFGDKDSYGPDPDYADWECETEEEADEWFDSYNGFDEDEDVDY